MKASIIGTGSYAPLKRVTNEDLAKRMDTSDEWIRSRTGIGARHICQGEESVASLAYEAGKRALEMAAVTADELDLIIVATSSPNKLMPSVSCQVQGMLESKGAMCLDLSAACSGFVFGYHTAQGMISSGLVKTALVIGADCIANLANWEDRSTCVLFGDGAGAAVLQDQGCDLPYAASMHSDGTMGWTMGITCRNQKEEISKEDGCITMNGKEIFKFAVTRIPAVIQEVLDMAGLESGEISKYLLHQANGRILESISKKMKEPLDKFPTNLVEYANTSAASIPILLDQLNREGALHKGEKLILSGFGAGLSWGALLMEWEMDTLK